MVEVWKALVAKDDTDVVQLIAEVAETFGMPTTTVEAHVFRDGKTRNNYRRKGSWLVKWINGQRKAAGSRGNIFEHRWKGSKDPDAIAISSIDDLALRLAQRFGNSDVRFTWILMRERLVVGVAEDLLELGVAHLNLALSDAEEGFIGGEGCFGCRPRAFLINFLSGTFSVPIMRTWSGGPLKFQAMWTPVIQQMFSLRDHHHDAETIAVDYSQGMDMSNKALLQSIKGAEILADTPDRQPKPTSKEVFCNPPSDLSWMQFCVCTKGKTLKSWCDKSKPCQIEKCMP